ncbi:hypothetical protein [Elizabethkingia anophelis]|uniref:hypothetical protein n=1 Tax=Elizabethkingia anophelis TaxID=1117645 RepID=UPI00063AE97D|nr:hypothetical protein [Elizabethkingia anophelis]AKH95185.1 hypothetical protein M876_11470 [Elizabethkingia anophelis FMS-007]MCT3800788.1 hypothetical protein [Elizabethkingia anophelis]MCT4058123.1 hypothetical protein [Elizabethkingia anophelis]MCT4068732.1 hypothetical protein [Elizabethkingia anophelis]
MKTDGLSIADLKAALDFAREELKVLEKKAKQTNISPSEIPAYEEVKMTEDKLYNELLNIIRR